jgi:hypothetical protein
MKKEVMTIKLGWWKENDKRRKYGGKGTDKRER